MRKIIVIVFTLCVIPTMLFSQTRSKHLEVGFEGGKVFFGSYFKAQGAEYDGSKWITKDVQAQDDLFAGITLTYHFNPKWGVGFEYDTISTDGGGVWDTETDLDLLFAVRSFREERTKFTPFILGGIGKLDFEASSSNSAFSFQVLDPENPTVSESAKGEYVVLGGGCKIWVSKRIGFTLGSKLYLTGGEKSKYFLEPDPGDPTILNPISPPVDMMEPDLLKGSNSLSIRFSFGVSILVGKRKKEEFTE